MSNEAQAIADAAVKRLEHDGELLFTLPTGTARVDLQELLQKIVKQFGPEKARAMMAHAIDLAAPDSSAHKDGE